MAKPKETKEIKLLKSLFRKKNLEERFIFIPEYAQPMTFLALELDETLHEIVCMLCYIGEDIHLKEFKKFLLNYKVFKIENGALVEKAYISKSHLEDKLKLLELMSLIEIANYRIRMTTQALSYFNDVYTKTERSARLETKLERITKAKLIAYTSMIDTKKANRKELEDINVYEYTDGFVILQSNNRETFSHYYSKLNKVKSLVISQQESILSEETLNYLKDKNLLDNNFKILSLDNVNIEIKVEESIYNNYKDSIDSVFENKTIYKEQGHITCSKIKVNFNIKTF